MSGGILWNKSKASTPLFLKTAYVSTGDYVVKVLPPGQWESEPARPAAGGTGPDHMRVPSLSRNTILRLGTEAG